MTMMGLLNILTEISMMMMMIMMMTKMMTMMMMTMMIMMTMMAEWRVSIDLLHKLAIHYGVTEDAESWMHQTGANLYLLMISDGDDEDRWNRSSDMAMDVGFDLLERERNGD